MPPSQYLQNAAFDRSRREVFYTYDDGDWWWSQTGQIVRWVIFGSIFLLFILYMILGYWHAKRRLRNGLPPLAYHRWLLNRQQRAQFDPRYRDPVPDYSFYRPDQYGMHPYSLPPPVYDPHAAPPPSYQPPTGATKVDPTQRWPEPISRPAVAGEPSPEYTPPPGPPPAATLHANQTGSSSTSNNPYRQ